MKRIFVDKNKITEAIKKAEKKTGCEIVPYFTERSDDYEVARITQSTSLGIIATLVSIFFSFNMTSYPIIIGKLIPLMIGFSISLSLYFLCGFQFACRRFFLTNKIKQQKTYAKAKQVFYEQEIYDTKKRNGILIYFSFFERKIHLLADKGLNKIPNNEWQLITKNLAQGVGFEKNNVTNSLIIAIEETGKLIKNYKLVTKKKKNMIKDQLRRS